jgi:hypothetical protein
MRMIYSKIMTTTKANATLETYIQTARNRGMTDEAITLQFLEMGWSEPEITAAMDASGYIASPPTATTPAGWAADRPDRARIPASSRLKLKRKLGFPSGNWAIWTIAAVAAVILAALAFSQLWK